MKKIINIGVFAMIFCSLTSCGTIINGTRQDVSVTSNQPGAIVSDGVNTWTTPVQISLKRKKSHQLTITKPGYETQVVTVHRALSGVVAANLLMGPFWPIGWGVDAISGGQYRLIPETVDVQLRPVIGSPISPSAPAAEVAVVPAAQ